MAKRRYGMTEERIAKFLREGRGQGRLADYKPWLTIHDISSLGLSSRTPGATAARFHHLLSANERKVFLDCDWLECVVDVREQFPLERGETMVIAKDMGVRHPHDLGIDVVMTTDLLIDYVGAEGPRRAALSVKYAKELEDERGIEKLEIERRFWRARDVPYYVVTEREISEVRAFNLLQLGERRSMEGLTEPREGYWASVCLRVMDHLEGSHRGSLAEQMARLESASGWREGDGLAAIRHLASNRRVWIDVDAVFDPRGPSSQVRVIEAGRKLVA